MHIVILYQFNQMLVTLGQCYVNIQCKVSKCINKIKSKDERLYKHGILQENKRKV